MIGTIAQTAAEQQRDVEHDLDGGQQRQAAEHRQPCHPGAVVAAVVQTDEGAEVHAHEPEALPGRLAEPGVAPRQRDADRTTQHQLGDEHRRGQAERATDGQLTGEQHRGEHREVGEADRPVERRGRGVELGQPCPERHVTGPKW